MLKKVWISPGYLEGQIIKSFLESYGLEVFTFEESVGLAYGLTTTPLGEVEIYVRKECEQEALKYLEDFIKSDDSV